jgi:hypothetical protein
MDARIKPPANNPNLTDVPPPIAHAGLFLPMRRAKAKIPGHIRMFPVRKVLQAAVINFGCDT